MNEKIEPGIHFGISFDEYRKIDAVNSSSLKNMLVSPLNYKYKLENESQSSKSMDIGRAAHTAILEPDKFDGLYAVYDGIRRGKVWDAFKDENCDAEILTRSEFEKVEIMRESVARHRRASDIIKECDSEVTLVFVEQSTGLLCKARIDSLDKAYRYFADLKTSRDVDPNSFGRQNATLSYHFQYGFYRMAIHALTGIWVPVKCVAVQNAAPFDTVVYSVPDDAVDKGMSLVMDCMQQLKECRENDRWPGIAEEEIDLEFPAWIYDYEEEEIE